MELRALCERLWPQEPDLWTTLTTPPTAIESGFDRMVAALRQQLAATNSRSQEYRRILSTVALWYPPKVLRAAFPAVSAKRLTAARKHAYKHGLGARVTHSSCAA